MLMLRRAWSLAARASARLRRALVLVLLVAFYVVVLPWFALARRARRPRAAGWRERNDPRLTELERLRSRF
jgi:4-amino-4-deoxy-L-arabinose transferase-like glycosyltransferase